MGLLTLTPSASRLTLDELWAEAETIGEPSLDTGWVNGPYKGRISFKNGSSRIVAEGYGKTPVEALINTIAEARRIGGAR